LRTELFTIGAIILVLGLLIVVNYQYPVSALESMFGGWAMLSEVHQERVAYLSMGYIIVVIGIIIIIPGIILMTKSGETKKEDESTFKYKDEEIQPETHSEKVLPIKPKRDLKKSPTLKGTIIGIIAVSIIYGSIWGLTYQAFVMSNDAMAPTINKYDLIRYDNTPFDEIQVNDIIFYSDPIDPKTLVHKVIQVDSSKVPRTLTVISEENIAPHLIVLEEQYIGKLDSIIEGAGYYTRILDPKVIVIILISAFAIPIAVMKIWERRKLKPENS